jgi:hypothetical protein
VAVFAYGGSLAGLDPIQASFSGAGATADDKVCLLYKVIVPTGYNIE